MESDLAGEEKHKVWKNNASYFYDRLLVQKLKWASLTFQWLPYCLQSPCETKYRFIYASHSSEEQANEHLYLAELTFPNLKDIHDSPEQPCSSKMTNLFKFTHEVEINKARFSETHQDLFAARVDNGPIAIFKWGEHFPVKLLQGQLSAGFALDWKLNGMVSGDFDGRIHVWKNIDYLPQTLNYSDKIEDTKWVSSDIIATGSDDGMLNLWDIRSGSIVQSVLTTEGMKDVYSVSPNLQQPCLILTGGEDHHVRLWDTRNLQAGLHHFEGHSGSVMTLEWSPVNRSVFASGSLDKTVKIWDLMRVGFEIPKDLGGTDELLFTHEGHQGGINDLSWNHSEMILGSTEEDMNTLQFYQIANSLHDLEYHEDLDYLRSQCLS